MVALLALTTGLDGCISPTASPAPPGGGQQLVLGFDQFHQDVEPVLVRQGCTATDCRDGGIRGSFAFAPQPMPRPADRGDRGRRDDDRNYERGQKALDGRRWDEALELFSQVATSGNPRADGALYWKAYALGKLGRREDALAAIFDAARGCRAARLVGLMLLPPAVDDPEQARPHFRELRAMRERLIDRGIDRSMLAELSMGMSHDFEVAVEEGATLVRVGTAIFGERARPQESVHYER